MKIQINTDSHIEGNESLSAYIRGIVQGALGRNSIHITRVEVHLSDENSDKRGHSEKRCMMEARLESQQPIAVSSFSKTLEQAIESATDKITHLVASTLERQRSQRHRRTDPPQVELEPEDEHD
ncbi:MAG: HPF/RaiA family ribosome-associated protein [Deltaproteobacteria bacterium]|nr:HPF/RaiA family ribosome-associated protein [Deltaproteobacteria bacterium]